MKYVVSYGAGVNSTALILFLIHMKMRIDFVVFADTGNEVPETYYFIKHFMEPFLKEHNIPFYTVYPFKKKSLWTRCWLRKVIPDKIKRWCTRDVKVKPIHKLYKKIAPGEEITQYMGIHAGEAGYRVKPSGEDWIHNSYPLIDHKINQEGCAMIIIAAKMPVPVKSGCFFCVFNTKERWDWLRETHPDLYSLAMELQKNNKRYPKQVLISHNADIICDSGYCMT